MQTILQKLSDSSISEKVQVRRKFKKGGECYLIFWKVIKSGIWYVIKSGKEYTYKQPGGWSLVINQLLKSQDRSTPLHITYFNAKSLCPKINVLCIYCELNKPDLIFISETWLGDDITTLECSIPGPINCGRCDRYGHGEGLLCSHLTCWKDMYYFVVPI